MGTIAVRSFRVFGNLAQKAGPYLLLEILLPGGTLFALLLFLYRRSQELGATQAPWTRSTLRVVNAERHLRSGRS